MWRDPTRPASSYDVRSAAGVGAAATAAAGAIAAAAASGVVSASPLLVPSATAAPGTLPCLPCHDDVGPMTYGASSGYAAALRRLARQAETAAGAGRGLQAIRGRGGVDDHRRLGTSGVRQDVAASTGSGATVTTLHDEEPGKGGVAAVVGSVGDRRSNEDVRDNDGASLFSYQAAVATPPQYAAYLRPLLLSSSTTEASDLGASLIDEAATNFSSSSSASSASFPSFVGCWPNVAASDAVAAAQLCLLRLMTYREALHPQQVQQQQLLLQHLLAHTLLSSSGAGALAASAGVVAPMPTGAARSVATAAPQQQQQQPPGSVGSSAAKSSADGTSEPAGTSVAANVARDCLKQERKSPGDEDRVGFRPYSASNRCNGLVRNAPVPSLDGATAPASSRSDRISPRPVPTSDDGSSYSKNVAPAESDMATHLDAARKQPLRKRVNVCSIRHRQTQSATAAMPATLIGERDTFSRPMAVLPRPTPSADGSWNGVQLGDYCDAVQECRLAPDVSVQESRESDGRLQSFSTLDLAEARRQSRIMQCLERAASDDDETDEGDEAKVNDLAQRRLVIRTPLVTPSTGSQREPAEKKLLLAAVGLATVHDATEMKCIMINRRRMRLGMRSELDDLDARLRSLSPLLDRLHASSSLHASKGGAKAPRETCPALEGVDKVEFLLQLGLCSNTNSRCSSSSSSDGCNNGNRSDRRSPNYSAHSAGDASGAVCRAAPGLDRR